MRRSYVFLIALTLAAAAPVAAQKVTITATPAHAGIYKVDAAGNLNLLGTGTAQVKVEKKEPVVQVLISAEGFEPIARTFVKDEKYPKKMAVALVNRLVKVTALPYDAQIFVGGVAFGTEGVNVIVPQGKSATVEVKKPGFMTKTRTYYNIDGRDLPPVTEMFELADRSLLITAFPSGAQIFVDGTPIGETTADVQIPEDKCVAVKVAKAGYSPAERIYCNKDQTAAPPLTESFALKDRITSVRVSPEQALISVNGREVGRGDFSVTIPEGECVEVIVGLEGFVQNEKAYCNQTNMQAPPTEEHFRLDKDEAYDSSVKTDQANVNFTIEVGTAKNEDQAWKLISQIVMNNFDVLEITDKETGYLRTSWNVTNFKYNTVRTRVIVKLGDTAPLKYVIKLASEHSRRPLTSVKADESFHEWDHVLNSYKDIINELQARLR